MTAGQAPLPISPARQQALQLPASWPAQPLPPPPPPPTSPPPRPLQDLQGDRLVSLLLQLVRRAYQRRWGLTLRPQVGGAGAGSGGWGWGVGEQQRCSALFWSVLGQCRLQGLEVTMYPSFPPISPISLTPPPPPHLRPQWILELDSTTDVKFSRHVIVRVPGWAFPDNGHVGRFVASLLAQVTLGWGGAPGGVSASERRGVCGAFGAWGRGSAGEGRGGGRRGRGRGQQALIHSSCGWLRLSLVPPPLASPPLCSPVQQRR